LKYRHTCRLVALTAASALLFPLLGSAAPFQAEGTAPAVAAFSKNGPAGESIAFSADDFRVEGDAALQSIVLTTLPDSGAGMLTIAGQIIPEGTEIAVAALDGLEFTPLTTPVSSTTHFTFSPVFEGGNVGEDVSVGIYLLSGNNQAPVAENLKLSTYKNVEISGSFAGVDPEGDLLTFQLVSKPARGAVTQAEAGSAAFIYTPYENKTGKDAFTYVAVDAVGNTSQPATVSIRIEKQKTKVTYSDMTGLAGHREAIRLAEAGLLVGEQMGEEYFFHPQEVMSRAQFTTLALSAAGVKPLEAVSRTGFADDETMAGWFKPYVSSALRAGLIQGAVNDDGDVIFQADAPITAAEAAVVLDRVLDVTDVIAQDTVSPAWCSQSVANLSSCGLLPARADLNAALTRADAAIMLDGALNVLEARAETSWFSW